MSPDIVLREAERGSGLWAAAQAFADARPLDYILVHADLHEPQAARSEMLCACRSDDIVALGSTFRPRTGRMLSIAGEDRAAVGALAIALTAPAHGRFAMMVRESDAPAVRRATGLTAGAREIHMALSQSARGGAPERAQRVGAAVWERVVEFYERLPGQVFFSDVFRDNPSYCVEEDGKVVAAAITHFLTPRVLQIGAVLTDPDYRRRGLAASVVAALANEAHAAGLTASLFVRSDNDGAIALYERLGFVRHQSISLIIGPE